MRTRKEEYIDRIAAQLREWSATIDELESRASRAPDTMEAGFDESIRILKERRELLSGRLEGLRASTGEAWSALTTGVDAAKDELRNAFAAAKEKFRKAA